MNIRNLQENESLLLDSGFEKMPLMPDWVWIAEKDGKQIGCLIGAPAHGTVIFLRISLIPKANPATVMLLLRRAFADCQERGFFAYLVMLADDRPAEIKLQRLIQKVGGTLTGFTGALGVGRFDLKPLE